MIYNAHNQLFNISLQLIRSHEINQWFCSSTRFEKFNKVADFSDTK